MLPSYFLTPSSPCTWTRTTLNLATVAAVLHHSDLDTMHQLQFPHLPAAGPFCSIYSAGDTQFSVVGVEHVATTFGLAYTEAVGLRRASGRIPLPSPLRPYLVVWCNNQHHPDVFPYSFAFASQPNQFVLSPCQFLKFPAWKVSRRFGSVKPSAIQNSVHGNSYSSRSFGTHTKRAERTTGSLGTIRTACQFPLQDTVVRPFFGAPRRAAGTAEAVGSI
ncbi:hypothetical protein DFH08DRAFT_804369 [Mycena albidolilacea]|uniref:Uncharacterized protein n=1 Tax=Mycena albidolilacea TaxID=1033008 RepID=A0AAD7ABV8_9AGAR|nr:hypothetical protein DFH08DRAFT_804369 [Mycena albidolilacea]